MTDPTPTEYLEQLLADQEAERAWPDYVIPADWWQQRQVLRDVHAWAIARLVPPEILLAHVFAELALRIPTTVVIPPIIMAPVALNFGAVVVAETGVGKSAGGRGLLQSATGKVPTGDVWPLGTGEGIAELLIDDDDEVRAPHGRPVLIHADEGRALEELVARAGSTLVSTLCSAVSGATIGQGNAAKKLRRKVPALTYRLAVILNIQPVYLRGILADVDGGLPQRFLFVSGTGHHLDAVDTDDPSLALELPDVRVDQFKGRSGSWPTVVVPETIAKEIRRDHRDRLHALDRGEPVAGGSHRNLLRIRLATLLAIAEERTTVTAEDWELALVPVVASDATVERGEKLRAELARLHAIAETDRAARHAVAASVAVESDATTRLARKVARWVRTEPGITRRDVARKLSSGPRGLLDDALEHAFAHGWIVERTEPGQGDDRRALYPGEVLP